MVDVYIYIYIYIYMCVCVYVCLLSFCGFSGFSKFSDLISVESPNTVSGRYAFARDPLQLDRFTDASSPSSGSVPC